MDTFAPIRAFFQRRVARNLTLLLPVVELSMEVVESSPEDFLFPAEKITASIHSGDKIVGHITYSLGPLGDRIYISWLAVTLPYRRQYFGISVLWLLHRTHRVAIIPVQQLWTSNGFWDHARERLSGAGAQIEPNLQYSELQKMQQRWKHLVATAHAADSGTTKRTSFGMDSASKSLK